MAVYGDRLIYISPRSILNAS